MCGKREGCYADCKNNPAYRLLRERLSMCEARVKWRNIAIARFDRKKGEQTAHACDIIFDSGVREMCGNAVQNQPKPAETQMLNAMFSRL
jgi:hypothetical protein